jgi:hypothetical protein
MTWIDKEYKGSQSRLAGLQAQAIGESKIRSMDCKGYNKKTRL